MKTLLSAFFLMWSMTNLLQATVLYDLTFESPHEVDQVPITGNDPSYVTRINFGQPTVSDYTIASGNSLEFEARADYEQISLNLDSMAVYYEISYDLSSINLLNSGYLFKVTFDTPIVRNLTMHGDINKFYVYIPGSYTFLPAFDDDTLYHFVHSINLASNSWTIAINDTPVYSGPFDATSIESIRFSISPAYGSIDTDALDSRVYLDNISVSSLPAQIPEPATAFLLLAGLVTVIFLRSHDRKR